MQLKRFVKQTRIRQRRLQRVYYCEQLKRMGGTGGAIVLTGSASQFSLEYVEASILGVAPRAAGARAAEGILVAASAKKCCTNLR